MFGVFGRITSEIQSLKSKRHILQSKKTEVALGWHVLIKGPMAFRATEQNYSVVRADESLNRDRITASLVSRLPDRWSNNLKKMAGIDWMRKFMVGS